MVMRFFRRGKKDVVCPGCLAQVRVSDEFNQTCPSCGKPIPTIYIQRYDDAPPIIISIFGWSNHGKTFFLDALRLILMEMSPLWPGYFYQSLTQLDLDTERMLREARRQGRNTEATQRRTRDQNEAYVMLLEHVALWDSRMLVMMDHPGESFENMGIPTSEIPYLVGTETTVMLVSLPDLIAGHGSLNQLLTIYIDALTKQKVNFRKGPRRRLIIAFTQADRMIKALPQPLQVYLQDDEVWPMINSDKELTQHWDEQVMEEYVERMKRVSDEISKWMSRDNRNVPGGTATLAMIAQYNLDARFTIMTATGGQLNATTDNDTRQAGFNIAPRRVLDTFLWALEFQSKRS